jgi:hypothetical protein
MITMVVYIDRGVPGETDWCTETLEFPDGTPDAEIEEDCKDCLDTMIANNLDCGWYRK